MFSLSPWRSDTVSPCKWAQYLLWSPLPWLHQQQQWLMETMLGGTLCHFLMASWQLRWEQWDLQDRLVLWERQIVAMEIQEGDGASDLAFQCHSPPQQNVPQGIWTSGHQSMSDFWPWMGTIELTTSWLPTTRFAESVEKDSSQSSNELSGLNIKNAKGVAASVLDQIVRERVKTKQQNRWPRTDLMMEITSERT